MSNMIDDILSRIPAEELAARLGTDPDTAMDAARTALPALLAGLDMEVQSGKADALGVAAAKDHDPGLLAQENPLALVDFSDGEKILGHMFGNNRGAVEQRLGASGKAEAGLFSKLLPMLAPLVMSWLAGRMQKKADTSSAGGGGGGLGDVLGGLLGGGGAAGGAGGGLGDLLGGILGGEKEAGKQAMPDLGGLFDMFGGGGDQGGDDDKGGLDIGDLLKPR